MTHTFKHFFKANDQSC